MSLMHGKYHCFKISDIFGQLEQKPLNGETIEPLSFILFTSG